MEGPAAREDRRHQFFSKCTHPAMPHIAWMRLRSYSTCRGLTGQSVTNTFLSTWGGRIDAMEPALPLLQSLSSLRPSHLQVPAMQAKELCVRQEPALPESRLSPTTGPSPRSSSLLSLAREPHACHALHNLTSRPALSSPSDHYILK